MPYTCSKPQGPLALLKEMNFVIAVLVNKGSSFLWNFKDIMQRQHPGSPKKILKEQRVYMFLFCSALWRYALATGIADRKPS